MILTKVFKEIIRYRKHMARMEAKSLVRQPCFKCQAPAIPHHENYHYPLDVIWVCNKHHRRTGHSTGHKYELTSADIELAATFKHLCRVQNKMQKSKKSVLAVQTGARA